MKVESFSTARSERYSCTKPSEVLITRMTAMMMPSERSPRAKLKMLAKANK
jgi:hypothetical protein